MTRPALLPICLCAFLCTAGALSSIAGQGAEQSQGKTAPGKAARISLSPRFAPGQSFLYQMQFQNSTTSSRTGFATDPQGPSRLTIIWDTSIRLEVFPGEASAPGSYRLRITYVKSSADVQSDSFDPDVASVQEQYAKLTGKQIEFTLDAAGNVTAVKGLEGLVEGEDALATARKWIAQIASGPGAPAGGVAVGQKWISDEAADSLPLAGLVWRTDSQYLRNEACHQASLDSADSTVAIGATPVPAPAIVAGETCAVILSSVSLVSTKSGKNSTPEVFRQKKMETAGKWNGMGQSLGYISLKTGLVVSLTETGNQAMDVTFTTEHLDSLRYSGTILSHSQVSLIDSGLPPAAANTP